MEWLIVVTLIIFGANQMAEEEPPVVEVVPDPIVSTTPVYERGRYYKTHKGYFVSNLTPAPDKADGCDRPILTANLDQPRSSDSLDVKEIQLNCEGEG